jgi:hypothetical protein
MKTTKKLLPIFVLIILSLIFGGLLQADSLLPEGYLPIILGGEQGSGPLPTSTAPVTPKATATGISNGTPDPTSTIAPTTTPTSTANQTREIPNGDFEDGRTVWTESSKWGNIMIVQDDDLPRGISPHNGRWSAWLGGDNDEEAYIEQRIIVDPDFPYLAYWYWIDWPFSCQGTTAATATLSLDQSVIWQSGVCEDTDSGGWVKKVIDIGAFAGRSADLRFQITTKANSFANLYLDDVVLQSSP